MDYEEEEEELILLWRESQGFAVADRIISIVLTVPYTLSNPE